MSNSRPSASPCDKLFDYRVLVRDRKACVRCRALGLTNPATGNLAEIDSEHIGPWTGWQGDLNARVLVVGQEWGDVAGFRKQKGLDTESATNAMLRELLRAAGVEIEAPPTSQDNAGVFLTNAALCLKEGGAQAPVRNEWFVNCAHLFLRPQIELVAPRVVVSMGERAYRSVMRAFGLRALPFRTAVESKHSIPLFEQTVLVPVYHCGRRILNTHRRKEAQVRDWLRVRMALTTEIQPQTHA